MQASLRATIICVQEQGGKRQLSGVGFAMYLALPAQSISIN